MTELTKFKPCGALVLYQVLQGTWYLLLILIGLVIARYFVPFFPLVNTGTDLLNASVLILGIGIFILILFHIAYYMVLFKYFTNYRVDTEGVHSKVGIFNTKQVTVPYNKITNINIKQNIIEKVLGYWNIGVQTAGSPYVELEMYGITEPEQLKHLIMEGTKCNAHIAVRQSSPVIGTL